MNTKTRSYKKKIIFKKKSSKFKTKLNNKKIV